MKKGDFSGSDKIKFYLVFCLIIVFLNFVSAVYSEERIMEKESPKKHFGYIVELKEEPVLVVRSKLLREIENVKRQENSRGKFTNFVYDTFSKSSNKT